MKKSAKVWQFVQRRTGSRESWTWRRLRADGLLEEISLPQGNFGKVVADALAHGFQPRRELWETRAGEWITQFTPGKAPTSIREAAPPASRSTRVRKTTRRNSRPRELLNSPRVKPSSPDGSKPGSARKPDTHRPQ